MVLFMSLPVLKAITLVMHLVHSMIARSMMLILLVAPIPAKQQQ
jgi:hypothetical protein